MPSTDQRQRPSEPALAAVLSFVCAGAGQLYNGQPVHSLIWVLSLPVLSFVGLWLMATFPSPITLLTSAGSFLLVAPVGSAIHAGFHARRLGSTRPARWYNQWRVLGPAILMIYVALSGSMMGVRASAFEAFWVPTGAMSNTILAGDRVLATKLDRNWERGDVVVFRRIEYGHAQHYVKRIIGLPGDTLEVRRYVTFVNGIELDEPYVHLEPKFSRPESDHANHGPILVPPGHYFMMGDARDRSKDSRIFGPVPQDSLLAKPRIVYWSRERFPPESPYSQPTNGSLRWSRIGRPIR